MTSRITYALCTASINTHQLNPRFFRVIVKIAKTIGLTQAFCEIKQTPKEGDFEDTDTSARKTAAEQSASFLLGQ
jgi:hypothetical protein